MSVILDCSVATTLCQRF